MLELATCKRIDYTFFEELFVVRQILYTAVKAQYFFDFDKDIIKHNCDFTFYYNKTDITPTVLDRGNNIILANWPNDKHIICTINNDIPIEIPSHPLCFGKQKHTL